MKIEFNTNRDYGKHGQPMVGTWNGEYVMFADLARSMHGQFRWDGGIADKSAMQSAIMNNYDAGIYEHTAKTYAFFQFEKKVWNDVQKEKTRSKAGRQLIEQLEKLDSLADDIRAQFEEIANEFHQDEGPALDPKHSDDDTSYQLYELAYDVSSAAEDLRQQIHEYQETIKEVTK